MRRLAPRFGTRTMLLVVAVLACTLVIGERANRIHSAARLVEANGGNVWLDGTLYSGAGLGNQPRTRGQVIFDRAKIICSLIGGDETDLWLCYIPERRDVFGDAIELLNPNEITIDALGKTDRAWLLNRFPDLERIRTIGLPEPDDGRSLSNYSVSETSDTQVAKGSANREDFVRSMESVARFFAENPQLAYRLQRYETRIGYPAHGEMGRIFDRETGRTIYLPWPK